MYPKCLALTNFGLDTFNENNPTTLSDLVITN